VKRFVNGVEVELSPAEGVEVRRLPDRLVVKGPDGAHTAVAVRRGDSVLISYRGQVFTVEKASARSRGAAAAGSGEMRAPMPGLIVDVVAVEGQTVTKGDKILVLEAMKTQQAFSAPFDGTVTKLPVQKGEQVAEGQLLAVVEAAEQEAG
jgi:3-methylcrotonyl-CoA carboxylase alpha subunit